MDGATDAGPTPPAVSDGACAVPAPADLLRRVVEAAGGSGGILTTWDVSNLEDGAHTTCYNIDSSATGVLERLLVSPDVALRGPYSHLLPLVEEQVRLAAQRAGLDAVGVLAVPVRFHERSIGVLCLLHSSNATGLLQQTPGVYSLRLDEAEAVERNARLLQRLLTERKWLEAIVSQHASGIVFVDGGGRILGFNPAMERLSGWGLEEAVGRAVSDVFVLRCDRESVDGIRLFSDSKSPDDVSNAGSAPREAVLCSREGEWVDVEVTTITLLDESRASTLGWAMTVRDIGARKEKERLERVFLSGVSHELQTPIAVIKGFSGMLSDDAVPFTQEEMRQKAAIIYEEGCRLERMVRQLMFATQLEAGGLALNLEPTALHELLGHWVEKLAPLATARGCRLEAQVPANAPLVTVDAEKVEQVVTNLIENAIKYSVRGGGGDEPAPRVRVSMRVRDRELEIDVDDNGPGLDLADSERVFHAFARGSGATRAQGAGLGLFIARSIVRAHGGRIGVDRSATGGARFYFTVPWSV